MSNEERRGGESITRFEAHTMVTNAFEKYERDIAGPRNEKALEAVGKTLAKLEDIETIVSEGRGGKKMLQVIGAAAGILWIVLQIFHFVTGHSITIGSN